MKNQFAKIVAVLMVLAMAVSVFGLCASAAETTTDAQVALLGDVNLDGKVSIQDATLIQKAIAKLATLDEVQTAVADATEDGNVNIKDATAIQKWIAKFEDANQNIGKPMGATDDEASTDESTKDQATVDEATKDEATTDEATNDEATTDEATKDEATKDEPVVDEPTVLYYVAGVAELTGYNWDPAGAQMTDDGDGTWSITFTGIAAGSYEFKVTNGTWDLSYNLEGEAMGLGTNAVVNVEVDNATVIIGFDGTKAIVEFVTAPATQDEPVVDPATKDEEPATKDEEATADEATADEVAYYLVGWINGTDVYDATYAFVDGTITVELTSDSYFAVQDENGTIFWTDGWLDFNPTSAVLGEFGGNNNKFHAAAGTVTLTWDAATCTLTRA